VWFLSFATTHLGDFILTHACSSRPTETIGEQDVGIVLRQFNALAYRQLVIGGPVDEASVARAIEADLVSVPPTAFLEAGWSQQDTTAGQ
jgi:hypothetical protein